MLEGYQKNQEKTLRYHYTYPKIDFEKSYLLHFQKYPDIAFHLKIFYGKRLILKKGYKRKTIYVDACVIELKYISSHHLFTWKKIDSKKMLQTKNNLCRCVRDATELY